jgi:hypothetical protein
MSLPLTIVRPPPDPDAKAGRPLNDERRLFGTIEPLTEGTNNSGPLSPTKYDLLPLTGPPFYLAPPKDLINCEDATANAPKAMAMPPGIASPPAPKILSNPDLTIP